MENGLHIVIVMTSKGNESTNHNFTVCFQVCLLVNDELNPSIQVCYKYIYIYICFQNFRKYIFQINFEYICTEEYKPSFTSKLFIN
jgi:rRNA maturation protein Rpf1